MASLKKRIEKVARQEILRDLFLKRVRLSQSPYTNAYLTPNGAWTIKDVEVSIEERTEGAPDAYGYDWGMGPTYAAFDVTLTVVNKAGHKRHVSYDLDLD